MADPTRQKQALKVTQLNACVVVLQALIGCLQAWTHHLLLAVLSAGLVVMHLVLTAFWSWRLGIAEGEARAPEAAAREIRELKEALEDARCDLVEAMNPGHPLLQRRRRG